MSAKQQPKTFKKLRSLAEFSPFKLGVITTILFTTLVVSYYKVPAYRIRESPAWVQGLYRLHEYTIDIRFKDRGEVPPPGDQVALVVVDEDAVEKIGRWPWPRTTIGKIIEELMKNGARFIGF